MTLDLDKLLAEAEANIGVQDVMLAPDVVRDLVNIIKRGERAAAFSYIEAQKRVGQLAEYKASEEKALEGWGEAQRQVLAMATALADAHQCDVGWYDYTAQVWMRATDSSAGDSATIDAAMALRAFFMGLTYDALRRVTKERDVYRTRLELDYCYGPDDEKVPITDAERERFPDGIEARDATIQLLDEVVAKLQRDNAALLTKLPTAYDIQAIQTCVIVTEAAEPNGPGTIPNAARAWLSRLTATDATKEPTDV